MNISAKKLIEEIDSLEYNDELGDLIKEKLQESDLADYYKGYLSAWIEIWGETYYADQIRDKLVYSLKTWSCFKVGDGN